MTKMYQLPNYIVLDETYTMKPEQLDLLTLFGCIL